MFINDSFVRAEHQYRGEQLKKSYQGDSGGRKPKTSDSRIESRRVKLVARRAWSS